MNPSSKAMINDAARRAEESLHQDCDPGDWITSVVCLVRALDAAGLDRWQCSRVVGEVLFRHSWVPLLQFAFGGWHSLDDAAGVIRAAELSTTYLLRMIPVPCQAPSTHAIEVGSGAYSVVWRDGSVAYKVPCNVAGREFAVQQEARVLAALNGLVPDYVPAFHSYDSGRGQLIREYLEGPTGHDCLVLGDPDLSDGGLKVAALRVAHSALFTAQESLGVRLDLHPGNFVWSDDRWVLVDAGPVPYIGSWYYGIGDFDGYFTEVWSRRLLNMREMPVRSVDWFRN
ncbi:hypothetical protein KJY99_11580 [Cutibacterium avidum]|nr:hypothetical protein [Cutibacterium avidum]